MELNVFLSKNKVNLDPEVKQSCERALEKMAESQDILHNKNHVLRMLDLLDYFLSEIYARPNFNILLLAICWHDVWKAKAGGKSSLTLLFKLYWDGIGSARIFAAENQHLPKEIFTSAHYAIRRHSPPRPWFAKTFEIKILRDIDSLEEWSLERLDGLVKQFLNQQAVNYKLITWFKLYFDVILKNQKTKHYYFPWSKTEFERRKAIYILKVDSLLRENNFANLNKD